MIGGNRGSSTATKSESIDGVEPPGMLEANWSVSFRICLETTHGDFHWLIRRFTGAVGGAQPITEAQSFIG